MDYYEDINSIIIYGGRNDGKIDLETNAILNDLNILNLETFNWINVEVNGLLGLNKCSHNSTVLNS